MQPVIQKKKKKDIWDKSAEISVTPAMTKKIPGYLSFAKLTDLLTWISSYTRPDLKYSECLSF